MKIIQKDRSKVFFSSDTHISHRNICAGTTSWLKPEEWPTSHSEWTDHEQRMAFCKAARIRDFKTIDEMNSAIIDRFNERITETDILFLLGDVGFGGKESVSMFMDRLRCKNVYLIYGNHDHNIETNKDNIQSLFNSCEYYKEIYVDGQHIILSHYAMRVWHKSHRGSFQLYGHSHGSLPDDPNLLSMDVGVDTNDMRPYSFDEIKDIMAAKTRIAVDKH